MSATFRETVEALTVPAIGKWLREVGYVRDPSKSYCASCPVAAYLEACGWEGAQVDHSYASAVGQKSVRMPQPVSNAVCAYDCFFNTISNTGDHLAAFPVEEAK